MELGDPDLCGRSLDPAPSRMHSSRVTTGSTCCSTTRDSPCASAPRPRMASRWSSASTTSATSCSLRCCATGSSRARRLASSPSRPRRIATRPGLTRRHVDEALSPVPHLRFEARQHPFHASHAPSRRHRRDRERAAPRLRRQQLRARRRHRRARQPRDDRGPPVRDQLGQGCADLGVPGCLPRSSIASPASTSPPSRRWPSALGRETTKPRSGLGRSAKNSSCEDGSQ